MINNNNVLYTKHIRVYGLDPKITTLKLLEILSNPLFNIHEISLNQQNENIMIQIQVVDEKYFYQWFAFYQYSTWRGCIIRLMEMNDTTHEYSGLFSLQLPEDNIDKEFKFHFEPKPDSNHNNCIAITSLFENIDDIDKTSKCLNTWKDSKQAISSFCREKFKKMSRKKGSRQFPCSFYPQYSRSNDVYTMHDVQSFTMKH